MMIEKAFSVSSSKKVAFSSGNLQYSPLTETWSVAERQFIVIGENNKYAGKSQGGMMDLFSPETALQGKTIDSIGRLPTSEELHYLLKVRKYANSKYGLAKVAGVTGMILLPDDFELPIGLSFKSGDRPKWMLETVNEYTDQAFSEMEASGAVFLPCGGYRHGYSVYGLNSYGNYWASTGKDNELDRLYINQGTFLIEKGYSRRGYQGYNNDHYSMRLIRDL